MYGLCCVYFFFFSSRRRHTRCSRDWSSDVCSSDLFSEREFPVESAERTVLSAEPMPLVAVITKAGLAPSKTEARRLIAQGGVELDGEKVTDGDRILPGEPGREYRLKVGKKRFAVIRFEAKG